MVKENIELALTCCHMKCLCYSVEPTLYLFRKHVTTIIYVMKTFNHEDKCREQIIYTCFDPPLVRSEFHVYTRFPTKYVHVCSILSLLGPHLEVILFLNQFLMMHWYKKLFITFVLHIIFKFMTSDHSWKIK